MNYTDYRSTATIKNRALAERIKKSFFHYKTVRIGCKRNYATKKVTEYEEQIDKWCFDIAVMLGVRKTCTEDGSPLLTHDEKRQIQKLLNRHYILRRQVRNPDKMSTNTLDQCAEYYDESIERFFEGSLTEKDDGTIIVEFDYVAFSGLWRALSMMFPGAEIEFTDYLDYDDGDECCFTQYNFIAKFGTLERIDYHVEADGEELLKNEENQKEERSIVQSSQYDIAMNYAYKGEYQKSIKILEKLEGNVDALNDIGVNYERLGDYAKAFEYYKRSNTDWALMNILRLYKSRKIRLNLKDYERICKHLDEQHNYNGLLYMSYFYDSRRKQNKTYPEKAIEFAKKSYEAYEDEPEVILNYALVLQKNSKKKMDKEKSHRLLEEIIAYYSNIDKQEYTYVVFNYAWQWEDGFGCKSDIDRAIYWYIRTYELGEPHAAEYLNVVYSHLKTKKAQLFAKFWEQKFKEKCGGDE